MGWNDETFKMNENTRDAILGMVVCLGILPIFACILIAIGNTEVVDKPFLERLSCFRQMNCRCCVDCCHRMKEIKCAKWELCTNECLKDKCCKKWHYDRVKVQDQDKEHDDDENESAVELETKEEQKP